MTRFYVYTLAYPDGSVFYVGKGKDDRVETHEALARSGHKGPLYDTIRQIWSEGGQVVKDVPFATDDEQVAFNEEYRLIKFYDKARLVNQTSGGRTNGKRNEKNEIVRTSAYFDEDTLVDLDWLSEYYNIKGRTGIIAFIARQAVRQITGLPPDPPPAHHERAFQLSIENVKGGGRKRERGRPHPV